MGWLPDCIYKLYTSLYQHCCYLLAKPWQTSPWNMHLESFELLGFIIFLLFLSSYDELAKLWTCLISYLFMILTFPYACHGKRLGYFPFMIFELQLQLQIFPINFISCMYYPRYFYELSKNFDPKSRNNSVHIVFEIRQFCIW